MKKKWILPAAAALVVAIAVLVIVLVPRNNSSASPYAERNAEGNIVIRSKKLYHGWLEIPWAGALFS